MTRHPPKSTLFPYPPLFRSAACSVAGSSSRLAPEALNSHEPVHADRAAAMSGVTSFSAVRRGGAPPAPRSRLSAARSEEHPPEHQSQPQILCGLLLVTKKHR